MRGIVQHTAKRYVRFRRERERDVDLHGKDGVRCDSADGVDREFEVVTVFHLR